jgi:hypothetical protein
MLIDVHRESLFNLSLAQQRITDKGAASLFNAIPLCSLRTLNIRSNELTDACCSALKTLLASASNLEFLDMSHNEITDKGVVIFAPAIRTNRVLHALDLSHNKLDKRGMQVILDNLYDNPTMQSISLRCNLHDDNSAEEFLKARLLQRMERSLIKEDNNAFAVYGLSDNDGQDFFERNLQAFERSQTEAFRKMGKGSMAMKMVEDLTSDLGAYGKRLPSRDMRVGSPAHTNPFRRMDSGGSEGGGRSHIALARSNSADMHSYSRDSVGDPHRSDGESVCSEGEDSGDAFESDWMPAPVVRGRTQVHSRTSTPDLPSIDDGGEEDEEEDKAAVSGGSDAFSPFFDSESPTPFRKKSNLVLAAAQEEPNAVVVSSPVRPACKLGHTRGIPHIGSYVGSQPIRSATQRHRDSANHLMYTKVLTPADPPGTKPYPIINVGSIINNLSATCSLIFVWCRFKRIGSRLVKRNSRRDNCRCTNR